MHEGYAMPKHPRGARRVHYRDLEEFAAGETSVGRRGLSRIVRDGMSTTFPRRRSTGP